MILSQSNGVVLNSTHELYSCKANCISGGSYFRITIALNYSTWLLVIQTGVWSQILLLRNHVFGSLGSPRVPHGLARENHPQKCTLLLMEEIPNNHLGCKILINTRVNYQPQLVSRISEPSTVSSFQAATRFGGGRCFKVFTLRLGGNIAMAIPPIFPKYHRWIFHCYVGLLDPEKPLRDLGVTRGLFIHVHFIWYHDLDLDCATLLETLKNSSETS